jgi:hypothetical protein
LCEKQPAQFFEEFFFKTQLSDAVVAVAVAAAECLSSVLSGQCSTNRHFLEVVVEAISASPLTFWGKLTFFKQCIWRPFFKVPCLDFRAPNEATVLEAGGRQKYVQMELYIIAVPAIHILLPLLEAGSRQKYVQMELLLALRRPSSSCISRISDAAGIEPKSSWRLIRCHVALRPLE